MKIPYNAIVAMTGISDKTLTKLCKKLRGDVIIQYVMFQPELFRLGGVGVIVEIDESLFSKKRKYGVGNAIRQVWV